MPNKRPYDPKALGSQIRDLRKAKRMTLVELAHATNRSTGNISEIERGKTAVTIPVLQEIAAALGVELNWFFEGQSQVSGDEANYIVRKQNRRILQMQNVGLTEELLSPSLQGPLELLLTTFDPNSGTGEGGRHRKGDEAGYLITGQLEISIEEKCYKLEAGDSFSLPKGGTHSCFNPGPDKTTVLWAITPPTF
ncbi:helix-turn-helix domain-containing protein [Sneathiella glossodoripedis]|uniref:helix-turn-helix domain-containing protein n=1 Tax=Sneathiella glossodoripedis TaxID=418853 RepID=UPI00055FBAC9|nr:helix-turn-helix domain-containing protein [Sneathiella glossodoripedis]